MACKYKNKDNCEQCKSLNESCSVLGKGEGLLSGSSLRKQRKKGVLASSEGPNTEQYREECQHLTYPQFRKWLDNRYNQVHLLYQGGKGLIGCYNEFKLVYIIIFVRPAESLMEAPSPSPMYLQTSLRNFFPSLI